MSKAPAPVVTSRQPVQVDGDAMRQTVERVAIVQMNDQIPARDWHRMTEGQQVSRLAILHAQLIANTEHQYPGALYAFTRPRVVHPEGKVTIDEGKVLQRVVHIKALAGVFMPVDEPRTPPKE